MKMCKRLMFVGLVCALGTNGQPDSMVDLHCMGQGQCIGIRHPVADLEHLAMDDQFQPFKLFDVRIE